MTQRGQIEDLVTREGGLDDARWKRGPRAETELHGRGLNG